MTARQMPPPSTHRSLHEAGFTLIELLITMALIAIMFGLTAINLGQPQASASVGTAVDSLLADLKSQQLLAMAGDDGGSTTTQAQPHGIYLQANQYTLFATASYVAGDTNNFVVSLPQGISLTTTFPSAQVVFLKGSGEVQGYTAATNTITLKNANNDTKGITITRFGALNST